MRNVLWKSVATIVSTMVLGCVAEERLDVEDETSGERRLALEFQGSTLTEGSSAESAGSVICSEATFEGRNPGQSSCVIPDFGEPCAWVFPNECSDDRRRWQHDPWHNGRRGRPRVERKRHVRSPGKQLPQGQHDD
jgi:hypothetical protein